MIQGRKYPTLANTDGEWFGPLHFASENEVTPTKNNLVGVPFPSWTRGPPESPWNKKKQWSLRPRVSPYKVEAV